MRQFLLFLVFLVSGCYAPEGDEDMIFKPLQWGQTRHIRAAEWAQNKLLTIVTKDLENPEAGTMLDRARNPFVKNVTLGISNPPETGGTFALRWAVQFGVGGGSASFMIDANDLQQFSFSADQMRLSLVSEYPGIVGANGEPLGIPYTYSNPTFDIEASAFFAEGMTNTDSPTYTQRFTLDANAGAVVPIPKFASAFRVLGDPSASNTPFSADMTYSLKAPDGVVTDLYAGDDIFPVRLAPMPTGIATSLTINNAAMAAGASGALEWSLDL